MVGPCKAHVEIGVHSMGISDPQGNTQTKGKAMINHMLEQVCFVFSSVRGVREICWACASCKSACVPCGFDLNSVPWRAFFLLRPAGVWRAFSWMA